MALSEKIKTTINGIRKNFPTEQALLIPALHEVQNEYGWVSRENMKDVGEFLNLPTSKVREVASFYTMFKLEPQGKVDLQICTNISCWLNGMTKALALALGPSITVNAICPGWIRTDMLEEIDPAVHESILTETALRRWGTPDDVAAAAVFLASADAAFITGELLIVAGGRGMH